MIQTESINVYFRKALAEAMLRTNALMSAEIQIYVIGMLSEFLKSENAFSGVDYGEKPVYALMLARAMDSEPNEALRLYRQIGDSTLYHLGFFKESMAKRDVNESYYATIGEMAYLSACGLSRPLGANSTFIYGELAESFLGIVEVFNDMSLYGERSLDLGEMATPRLLALMESYRKTNDPKVRDILLRQGVNLDPDPKKT